MAKILIVEDHAIIREPIEVALDNAGFETVVASNGVTGLAAFQAHKPDLVLLDIAMPEMDGMTMLRKLRALPGGLDVPVIMLTVLADRNKVVEAATLGIKGYVLKSKFSLHELLTLVRNHLPAGVKPAEKKRGSAAAAERSAQKQYVQHDASDVESQAGEVIEAPPRNPGITASARSDDGAKTLDSAEAAVSSVAEAASGMGAGREELRAVAPVLSRQEVIKRLNEMGELKGFSPAVAEVLKITSNARCSMEAVARAISRDHGLALKILKLANSPVYTRGEPVDAVAKAVLRIGLGQIRQAVLNIAVIDRFADSSAGEHVKVGPFWEHAIATGIIGAEITCARNEKEADLAFTCGLLHDVGRLLMLETLGESYSKVLETAAQLQKPVEQVEQHMLGLQHAEVMEHTLKLWKFSKNLVTPIVLHHLSAGNIRTTAPQQMLEVGTLALANRLAHALMLGHTGNHMIYPTEDLCELLSLEPKVIERVEAIATEETTKVKFALLALSNQSNWDPMPVVYGEQIGAPFVPVYASSTPAFDAHRMFCKGLTTQAMEGEALPANIGVTHFRHRREIEPVWQQFLVMEKKAGAVNLPVILLSPTGDFAVPELMLAGRVTVQLSTPFAVPRFISTVRKLLGIGEAVRAAA